MSTTISREIQLASRPHGLPTSENFKLVSVELQPPVLGEVLVRNHYMSVDPYMRGRLNDAKSYVPPFQLNQPLDGGAVGEVIESNADGIKQGDFVTSGYGWREYFVADAKQVQKVDSSIKPLSATLGVLGMTGMTAWIGLNLAGVNPGDVFFVSGAAGAVGSIAGQLAKIRGCRVVGSAGSPEKVKALTAELGFDNAFNYKEGDILGQLSKATPGGIDVYFDNVGGGHLEAAISAMRLHGRIIACGSISKYNDETSSPGPSNLFMMVTKRLTMKGFIVSDSLDQTPAFHKEVGKYLAEGKLHAKETVVQGIEHAPQAFIDLFHGGNIGKMVVKLIS